MLSRLNRFARDNRGSLVQRYALLSGSIAVACVLAANIVDTASREGMFPEIVWRRGDGARTASNRSIDYTATATIPSIAAVTRLDPCTGKPK